MILYNKAEISNLEPYNEIITQSSSESPMFNLKQNLTSNSFSYFIRYNHAFLFMLSLNLKEKVSSLLIPYQGQDVHLTMYLFT